MPRKKKTMPSILGRSVAKAEFLKGMQAGSGLTLNQIFLRCRSAVSSAEPFNRFEALLSGLIDDIVDIQLSSFIDFVTLARSEFVKGRGQNIFEVERLGDPQDCIRVNIECLQNLGYQFSIALLESTSKIGIPRKKRSHTGPSREWRCIDLSDLYDFFCSFPALRKHSIAEASYDLFRPDLKNRGATATRFLVNTMVIFFGNHQCEHTVRRIVASRRQDRLLCGLMVS
jgi:hypothetical protein